MTKTEIISSKKKVLVVVGMHRSGTSCITRGLEVLGVHLGNKLMPPAINDNDKGFFEDMDFNKINMDLLNELGHDWHTLYPISSAELEADTIKKIKDTAIKLIQQKTEKCLLLGLKDPRASRLLPFWISVFEECNISASYIFAIRNPVSIFKSLLKRDNISPVKSTYLWLEHVIPCLSILKNEEAVVVEYEQLLTDPEKQLRRISDFLNLADPDTTRLTEYKNEFLDTGLQHEKHSDLSDITFERDLSERTHELLQALASDEVSFSNKTAVKKIKELSAELETRSPKILLEARRDSLFAIKSLIQTIENNTSKTQHLEDTTTQQEIELTKNKSLIRNLQDEFDERSKWAKQLDKKLKVSQEKYQILDEEFTERSNWANALNEEVQERKKSQLILNAEILKTKKELKSAQDEMSQQQDAIRDLNLAAEQKETHIRDLNLAAEQNETHIHELNLAAEQKGKTIDRLQLQVHRVEQHASEITRVYTEEIASLKASKSWKITAPLRGIEEFRKNVIGATQHIIFTKIKRFLHKLIYTRKQLTETTQAYLQWKARWDHLTDTESPGSLPKNSKPPKFSIIIPVYGQLEYTLQCLRSVFRSPEVSSHEIIIVDDCSPDDSYETLVKLNGISLYKNDVNQGFIRTCNFGASVANGEILIFLNNDTEVSEGWLDSIASVFEQYKDAGVVGSKLVYPDGRLQEAGGILWKDGSAWNFGHKQDPDASEFNYLKEADYCSGASFAIPRELFGELNGFDENYLPAYCEDSDLCMRVRAAGLKVYYQPFSKVVHYEGISNGTDITKSVKAYQVNNQQKMYERWKTVWEKESFNNAEHVFLARERSRSRKLILVIDKHVPQGDKNLESQKMMQFIRTLQGSHYIVKFWSEDLTYDPDYTPILQRDGIEAFYGEQYLDFDAWCKSNLGYFDYILTNSGTENSHLMSLSKHQRSDASILAYDDPAQRHQLEMALEHSAS